MKQLTVNSSRRTDFVDITDDVGGAVKALGISSGGAVVFVPHTTAAVTINENADPDVLSDMAAALEKVAPWQAGYRHSEGNAAAHVKASLVGSSVVVVVEDGRLRLGTWQGIYLCEFDGPRARTVWVTGL